MIPLSIKTINTLLFVILLFWWIGTLGEFISYYFPNFIYLLPFLKYNYSIVCHQQPEKLLEFGKIHTLVCSRCFGIYSGALVTSSLILLGLSKKINTKTLLIVSIPMFIDVILYSLNIYPYSKWIAFSTGILLGSIGFLYIHSSLVSLFVKNKDKN